MNIEHLLLAFYCGVIFFFVFKYISQIHDYPLAEYSHFVSVVVAYRNEETNISDLIEDLSAQDYPNGYEIILVNDHSTDQSLQLVEQQKNERIVSVSLPDHTEGKKQALKYGASIAKGEILLLTDADCRVKPTWLRLMCMPFAKNSTLMVAGPFLYIYDTQLLGFFQHIEQTLLWGFSKTMASIQHPVMCNGANLAIRKDLYLSLVEKIHNNTPTGDDIFLLQEVKKIDVKGIVYLDRNETITYSHPTHNLRTLLNQKIRWASKSSKLSDPAMNFVGGLFIVTNIYFLYSLICGSPKSFLIKTGFELFFLSTIYTYQFGKLKSISKTLLFVLKSFCILMIYPFYALLVAILAKTTHFEWKGRVYS
jgi:poly-beta-1,6-N-acetyl-D-glucosamine synthase